MAKRNPKSMNQQIMDILFGSEVAKNQPSHWTKWPEPQRSIYNRIWNNGYIIVDMNQLCKVLDGINYASDAASYIYPTSKSLHSQTKSTD